MNERVIELNTLIIIFKHTQKKKGEMTEQVG